MDVLIDLLLIIVGFVLLIKGADFLIDGASSLAKKFNISEFAIGLTIVAMGTSAPELVVNIISGIEGHHDVVFGNIIGSNIFNLLLILGIAGVIYPLEVKTDTVWIEIPFSLGATIILLFLVNDSWLISDSADRAGRIDGIILLLLFIGFIFYVFINIKKTGNEIEEMNDIQSHGGIKTFILILVGGGGLSFGGKLVVNNAVELANHFQLSQRFIGLTIVAAGTSLPELATSAIAAYKKRADLAVGNIIGSNIFNILLVLGVASVITPLQFPSSMNTDIFIVLGGTFLLFIFMFTLSKKKLDRWEAVLYLVGFICYMVYLFIRE